MERAKFMSHLRRGVNFDGNEHQIAIRFLIRGAAIESRLVHPLVAREFARNN